MDLSVRTDALTANTNADNDYTFKAATKYGSQLMKTEQSHARSYSCEMDVTLAAGVTDLAEIYGNATTTVTVTSVELFGTATAATGQEFALVRRSAANTGGTKAAGSVMQHDTADAAANSTPQAYSANPSALGATANQGRRTFLLLDTTAAATQRDEKEWQFTGQKGIVLAGTAQGLCIFAIGAPTIVGAVVRVRISWIELP